jgi:hypothetical protein
MSDHHRYRLDDLRRLGVELAGGVGVASARASALVSALFWYDAAGAPKLGIASLAEWIWSIQVGEVDPKAEGTISRELPATAVLDGGRGIGPLILRRAGEIAQEKAREVGVGMVQVVNLAVPCPAGWAAAEMAVGPMVGQVVARGMYCHALPVAESMPLVIDTLIAKPTLETTDWEGHAPMPASGALRDGETWVVSARAVTSFESLASFHERIGRVLEESPRGDAEVRPSDWQARRLDQIEHGLPIGEDARHKLSECAERLGIAWPKTS